LGYVDDALAIATARTLKKAAKMLQRFMEREGGGFQWSKDHNSQFEISKLAVAYFTYGKLPPEEYPLELTLQGTVIKRAESYKYINLYATIPRSKPTAPKHIHLARPTYHAERA
jgi:hypothetical protein